MCFSRRSLLAYLLLASYGLFSACLAVIEPPQVATTSTTSLVYLLMAYALVTLRLRTPPGKAVTLAIFRRFVLILAVLGCLQFAAQFAGIQLFSFEGLVPEEILNEKGFNLTIPLWHGASVYKANGVFLLEPSILSQFMGLGLVVEFLYFGAPARMCLLLLTLLLSFSGTGMLVLIFAILACWSLEPRAFARIGRFVVIGAVILAFLNAFAAPEYVNSIMRRTTELSSDKSSGFIRFVTPYLMLGDAMSDPRALVGFGPGTAERFSSLGYVYGVNALTKILLEYGIPGLTFYVLLLWSVFYRPEMRALSAVGMFLFVFGGGYHLSPTMIYTLTVLFAWGPELRPRTEKGLQQIGFRPARVRSAPEQSAEAELARRTRSGSEARR